MKTAIPALNEEGPQRRLSNQDDPLVVLERRTESGDERAFILVNTHEHEPREVAVATAAPAGLDHGDGWPDRNVARRRASRPHG